MANPSPEELQYLLGIHPSQVAAAQQLANAAQGGAVPSDDVPPPDQLPADESTPVQAADARRKLDENDGVVKPVDASGQEVRPLFSDTKQGPSLSMSKIGHNADSPAGNTQSTDSVSDLMRKPITPGPATPDGSPAHAALSPAQQEEQDAIAKRKRLTDTGSGISQFQHRHHIIGPVVRALEIAGSVAAPGVMAQVPGTEMHHNLLVNEQDNRIERAIGQEDKQSQTRYRNAQSEALENPTKPNAAEPLFDKAGGMIGFRDSSGNMISPNSPKMTPEMKEILNLAQDKPVKPATPEGQAYEYLIKNGKSPMEAFQAVQEAKTGGKPDTATQNKQRFQDVIGKLTGAAGNKLDPGIVTDPRKMSTAISGSKVLDDKEKQFALSYIAANPTPASQAFSVTLRGQAYGTSRPVQVLDTTRGNRPVTVSMDELNRAAREQPDRYVSASGATTALNKENLMEDIRGGIQQVRDALNNPGMPEFNKGQKIKIAVAMRERDPRSAIGSLITSGTLGTMSPEQEDYLIAHSILAEQAMAMRSVLGAGQGSQDLRAAITATFPGPTTPSKRYGLKQLDAFEKTVDRLERGIPNVPLKPMKGDTENGRNKNTLAGAIQPGERTATGPDNHTLVWRGKKWVDPANGKEVK